MDPVLKQWMFEHWIQDKNDAAKLGSELVYLLAMFDHPDQVKQIKGQGAHTSTDEEFEETTEMVKQINRVVDESKNKRTRRRRLKE